MKSIPFFCLLFFCLASQAQNWLQSNDYPSNGVDDGTAYVIGNKAYCGTGVVDWFALQRDFYAFDFTTDSWSTVAAMPQGEERQYANGFASDSFGYVFGGYNGHFLSDLWRYDPQNDQWQEMTSLPDSGRGGAASFVIDSIAYIIGGKTDSLSAINEVWAYNMNADSWQQKNDLPFGARWRSSSTSYNGKGYLGFGLDSTRSYHSAFYEYNPTLDSWTFLSNFPQGKRNYVKTHYLDGQLISVGGTDSSNNYFNDCWAFDLQAKTWTSLDTIPAEGRRGGISFSSASAIYYTTGLAADGSRFKETWKLEYPTSLWENQNNSSFNIYPNPTNELINIEYHAISSAKNPIIHILNSNGILVQEFIISKLNTPIDISHFSSGLYFILYDSKTERILKKIIKQ